MMKYFVSFFLILFLCEFNVVDAQEIKPKDGVYATNCHLVINVVNNEVEGVYDNDIKKEFKRRVYVKFFIGTDDGRRRANDCFFDCMDTQAFDCKQTSLAVNKDNKEIRYYVLLYTDVENCWYDCDDLCK